ncbi:MAG: putative rane protein [Mucilaginibacter sp.]|nr:putative rane protein [Mucilaginibacter sp.]
MNRIAGAILRYFIKGLLVVVPIGLALFLIYWAVSTIDKALNLSDVLGVDKEGKHIYIPGLGILNVVVVILIAGILVTNVVTDPIKRWFNRWLNRLPLIKFLYSSIKDLTEAFVGEEKKFNEPVLVEVNEFGLKKIGFIVQKDLASLNLPGEVAVYLPYSYSFAGQVIIIPSDKVKPIDKSAADMMKFVISGGVSGLDH